MGTNNSFLRILLATLSAFNLSSSVYSQTTTKSLEAPANPKESGQKIKWTSQLPAVVRKAFKNSEYFSWYIEKMTSYSKGEETIYTFYLNNSSLLDGEHRESMARKKTLTVSDKGVIVQKTDSN